MLKRLGKDFAVYGAADLVFRFVAFAVFPVYAHVFTVEEFGVYTLVSTTIAVISMLANLGLNNATQRYYLDPETQRDMQRKLVSTGLVVLTLWSAIVAMVLGLALYPVSEVLARRYGIGWTIVLISLASIIPEQIVQYCLDTLRLHFSPWRFMLVSLLKNLLGVAAGLVFVLAFDGGLAGLFLGALVGGCVSVPVALLFIRADLTTSMGVDIGRRLVVFGYPFVFVGLAYWLFGSVDRWMLAELSDARQLGLYAIAYKLGTAVVFLNMAFGQAWSPVAHSMRRTELDYRAGYARIFSMWFFFLVIAGSSMALFGEEFLRLLAPAEYWDAAPVLAILVMGIVLSGTTQVTAVGISIGQRTRLFAVAAWATAVVNIALNFLFIPRWGAAGAAAATLLSYALLTALYLRWSQILHPIPLEKAQLAYSAALVAGIAAAAGGIGSMGVSASALAAKIGILVMMVAGAVYFGILDLRTVHSVLGGAWRRTR